MSLRHYVRVPSGDFIEVTDRVNIGDFTASHCAEEGSVGAGTVIVNDRDGDLDIGGLRTWLAVEDEVLDPDNQVVYYGFTASRKIARGDRDNKQGVARVWTVDLTDANSILSRKVQHGGDTKRPAETDVARVTWLAGTAEAGIIEDFRYLFAGHTTKMDAVDYHFQRNYDVVNDASQASGKNYWLDYFEDVGQIGLWYGHAGLPDYQAAIALSNVIADIDDDGVFAISADTELVRDPSRVNSTVLLPYDGGNVLANRPQTATDFASRDVVMPSENVKTSAKALKRARRYLEEIATEEDRITTSVLVPSTHVNMAKAGQLINFRATHLPGYETSTPLRILKRTVKQLTPAKYQIDLELSAGDVLPVAGNAQARLYTPVNTPDHTGIGPAIIFETTGDVPQAGRAYFPLQGPLEYVIDDAFPDRWKGIAATGDGDVTITLSAGVAAVVTGVATVNLEILVNSIVVGSAVASSSGGLRFIGPNLVATADVTLADGDLVEAALYIDATPDQYGKVPQGTGFPNQYLEIVGTME